MRKQAPVKQQSTTTLKSNKWKQLMKNINSYENQPMTDEEKVLQLTKRPSDVSGIFKKQSTTMTKQASAKAEAEEKIEPFDI